MELGFVGTPGIGMGITQHLSDPQAVLSLPGPVSAHTPLHCISDHQTSALKTAKMRLKEVR